ncbi:thermonuclease family protein [Patescibacteria group bacterium]|nr:thermonuclease family protein [Patescibacteria group bacterium]
MKKKILYILGGLVALFIVIGIFGPKPEKGAVQNTDQDIPTVAINSEIENGDPVVSETSSTSKVLKTTTDTNSYRYYSVSSVVDGDTVKINVDGTIETFRLIGMDTPETVDPRKEVQCFGVEASNKAKELLSGKKVRIETDASQGTYDKYNRLLGYVYREDGLFYNKYMIEQGYAHEYTYNSPYKYQTEFKNAQKLAQDNLRGLWSPNTCNGNTTSSASTSTPTTTTTPPPATQSTGKYYTSSASNTKYYAPESCEYWKTWSTSNLRSFNSLAELQKVYPSRTLSPQCN